MNENNNQQTPGSTPPSPQPQQSYQPYQPPAQPYAAQPGPQPFPPQQPVNPYQPQPQLIQPNRPVTKRNKNLIIGLIVGGVALLLAIGAAVVFFTMFFVSSNDYKEASAATTDVKQKYDALGDARTRYTEAFKDIYVTDANYQDVEATYKKALDEYKAKVDAISSLRAMKDQQFKSKYDEFVDKNKGYVEFNSNILESGPLARTVAKDCDTDAMSKQANEQFNFANAVSWFDTSTAKCRTAADAMTKAPNEDVADLGNKLKKFLDDQRVSVEEMEDAYAARNTAALSRAYSEFVQLNEDNKGSLKDRLSGADFKGEKLDPTDQYNGLKNYVDARAR